MKKLLCIILSISMIFCCFCVSAFSATMTIKNETYPTELLKGSTFSAYGVITSSYNIMRVEIKVTDSSGNSAFSYVGKPGTTTYDVHNVDYLLTFSKLDIGTYTYSITASDTQSSNVVLLSKQFKVVSQLTPSALKISSETYPTSIVKGNTFSIYGTVSSDYIISSVTCAVYSSSGALQFTKTAYPDTYSYSLHELDAYMTFSKLSEGSYVYKVTASDSKTKNDVLLSKTFKVVSSAQSSSLLLNSANYPSTIAVGDTFSVKGTITSDYPITSVTIGVYNASGTAKFKYSGAPNTTSFDINSVDSQMTFSKLTEGTYTYKIVASDTQSSNVVLLQKSFSVIKSNSIAPTEHDVNWNVVDLSYWNEITSWDDIAKSVDGVILRIGYRTTASHVMRGDSTFLTSSQEAMARNIPVGCYFFSAALTTDEAIEEAEFVMNVIKTNKIKFDMPIYFDMETEDQVNLSQSECTEIALAFCNKLKENGYYVGVYCNKYFARDELYASQLSDYTMWIAQYGSQCTYDGEYDMWQYSETGSVPGLYGYVDMNYCYRDFPTYIKNNGYNGYVKNQTYVITKYEIKEADGIKLDKTNKTVAGVAPNTTSASFLSKYVTNTSDVTVSFSNTVSGYMVTGTKITFKKDSTVLTTYTVAVSGDVDGNAVINSADALRALEHAIGKSTLSGVKLLSADVDGNGAVNSADALKILQCAVAEK